MMKIAIINGPNLNLLGKREPEVYGNKDFDAYFLQLQSFFTDVSLTYYQSNVEGELINEIYHWTLGDYYSCVLHVLCVQN